MEKICGIYKITSPSGRIYIGQSGNINSRVVGYKRGEFHCQRLLKRSMKKYGWENHTFEIIYVCPPDKLDENEIHYINYFESNKIGLNLMSGGSFGMHSEKTKKIISSKLKGIPKTEEHRKNISKGRKGIKFSEDHIKNMSDAHIGQVAWNKGIPHSESAKIKNSESHTGENNFWYGKHLSDDHKRKISESQLEKIIPKESIEKMRKALTGR
ncbi:MAG: NUMOD3 domain-containing DNA-binding protein [Nanoarchaeota archaeon]